MKVLMASSTARVSTAVAELLNHGNQFGCTQFSVCTLQQTGETAVQLRPDVVILEVSSLTRSAVVAIHDLQEVLTTRILALGPADDAQAILSTLNAGAYKYIDVHKVATELPAALRRLRDEPPLAVQHGPLIAVVGACGGSGASTLAANLAASLSRKHRRCALIDLDLEGGHLATLLNLQPAHTLADFCRYVQRMDQSMFEKCLAHHACGLALMAPPQSYEDIAKVTPRGVRKAISMARNQFPYVVVDCHRGFRAEHAQVVFQADSVVIVMRLDLASVRQVGRTLEVLKGVDRRRIHLVANRCHRSSGLKLSDVESSLKMPVAVSIPENSRHVGSAMSRGIPLVLDRPRHAISRKFDRLAVSVNGKL